MSFKNEKVTCLIPARGGSKGVKNKNLKLINGKHLIYYSIKAATRSKYVDEIFVSSDSNKILEVSKNYGAKTIKRPKSIATDKSTAVDVIKNFIDKNIDKKKYINQYLIYLQPTSPLRNYLHVNKAFGLMKKNKINKLVSVKKLKDSPYKSFKINKYGRLKSLFNQKLSNFNRQDLEATYIPNGAIYIFKISDFVKQNGFPSNGSLPYVMNDEFNIDLDTIDDLKKIKQILVSK
tara:strand:- start:39636 stop:40337 length:702 start_codon:yes stop_codon:yes gene_type:complete